jgi:glycerol-3-phosphate acyltransferase PlsY
VFDVPPALVVIVVVGAYLLGTVPTAQLVGRRGGVDPTAAGSGNPGASNVYRLLGRRAGSLVLVGDLLKGLVPALVGLAVDGRELALAAGLAAVLGHVAPATRGFRGGKGVATAGGVALVLWPLVSVALTAVFVVVARATGTASIASLTMAVGLPLGVAVSGRRMWEVLAAAALTALVVVRHADNIRRLARGEERTARPPHTIPPTLE